MFKFSSRQLTSFQPGAEAEFIERVVRHLLVRHGDVVVDLPDHTCLVHELPTATLTTMVERSVARGQAHGLTWESSLCRFTVLRFTEGPRFDRHPRILRVLTDANIQPDHRIAALEQRLSERDWQTVAATYDPQGWHDTGMTLDPPTRHAAAPSPGLPPTTAAAAPDHGEHEAAAPDREDDDSCLECGADVSIQRDTLRGATVECSVCGTSFIVQRTCPLELDYTAEDAEPPDEDKYEDENEAPLDGLSDPDEDPAPSLHAMDDELDDDDPPDDPDDEPIDGPAPDDAC